MKIIGDVHGKLQGYKEIVDSCNFSICVGDFGFQREWDWYLNNVVKKSGFHYINPGNHDFGPYMSNKSISLGNYTQFWKYDTFTVRGAFSIDRMYRTQDKDWFSNEELTYHEGLEAFDAYCEMKPNVVISHDCPQFIRESWFTIYDKSNTSNLLQAMWEFHQPEMWIFGHHHTSKSETVNGTKFQCLAELQTINIL